LKFRKGLFPNFLILIKFSKLFAICSPPTATSKYDDRHNRVQPWGSDTTRIFDITWEFFCKFSTKICRKRVFYHFYYEFWSI